jgi:hypothetical protein
MAALEELNMKADELKNIRIADWLSKRSSAFPFGWHQRYVVLSGNFLFIYSAVTVSNDVPELIRHRSRQEDVRDYPRIRLSGRIRAPYHWLGAVTGGSCTRTSARHAAVF